MQEIVYERILTGRESPVDKMMQTPISKNSICSQNFQTTQATNQKYFPDKYNLDSAFKSVARQSLLSTGGNNPEKRQEWWEF